MEHPKQNIGNLKNVAIGLLIMVCVIAWFAKLDWEKHNNELQVRLDIANQSLAELEENKQQLEAVLERKNIEIQKLESQPK